MAKSDDAAVHYFSENDSVWFYDANEPDPRPAPGVVIAETGVNDFTVEITLTDLSTRPVKHVGTAAANPERYIEPRDREAGQL